MRGLRRLLDQRPSPTKEGKDFAWSRGIGLELSPIKTRSCRKKLSQAVVKTTKIDSYSNDNGPLRAMKALAREK
jgi:hypothetical protein